MRSRPGLPSRILLPLANPRTAADLVKIGAAVMEHGGWLTALGIVEVPEGMPLSEGATKARQARRLLQRVLEFAPDGVELRTKVRIGRRAAEGITEVAAEEEADLIIFGWAGKPGAPRSAGQSIFSTTIDEVVREAPCDICVVKQRGVREVGRILAPVRGGPHAELALRFADALGRYFDAEVAVQHVVRPDIGSTVRTQAERALAGFIKQHARGRTTPVLTEGVNVSQAILREAESADLVIMGATGSAAPPEPSSPDGALFGLLPEAIAHQARPTVIVVKTKEPLNRTTFERRAEQAETLEAADRAAEETRSIPARVDRWFAESNFQHQEFGDLHRLIQLKEKQGLTISVVLPTLNEAATIGDIVRQARRELMEKVPLVDELLVIDSASEDDTCDIATDAGARVVRHSEVLPRYGSYRGKGEALWKSLYETSGDLVVWSDTDITDWHPRFIYGTVGPMLTESRIG
ncbi:MAG: universal stress protein, partial [Chloroflexi bacterium]|nr:universal stress protein [Chloroflexota bacterium]